MTIFCVYYGVIPPVRFDPFGSLTGGIPNGGEAMLHDSLTVFSGVVT